MKFKKFEELDLKKAKLSMIKGGTSTTSYTQTGVMENEYEDCNGDGDLSEDEMVNGTLVDLPIGC